MTRKIKIVVEATADGYVAYPVGLKGIVVGQGETYAEAVKDCTFAISFHIETFGADVLDVDPLVLDVQIAEANVEV